MKKTFRAVLFWIHLAAGLVAGAIIAVMSFTGAVLAFEHEIVEWAERDLRRVDVASADIAARPLDELLAAVRAAAPEDARPAGITVTSDPRDAVAVSYGRDGTYYVNPYTAEVRPPAATRTHDFMHLMEDWHRRLALGGESRETGRAITGACNLAFLVLAVTGLYLWWPRKWKWRSIRPSVRFVNAKGKYRDWNWHNAWGFWSLVPIIVMAATGMVFSYPWANALVYKIVGEEVPQRGGPPAAGDDAPAFAQPDGAARLGYDAIFQRIATDTPGWTSIT
ncbi:MAG: PepSY-associated TM helix domain-containing protein, partial [Verrucomicrobiota bacterium]